MDCCLYCCFYTINSTTHKCNQHKTSVLSITNFCDYRCCISWKYHSNGDAAATIFNPFNTDINEVRGQETGYPTWNPLDQGSGVTLSQNNFKASINGSTNSGVRGTMVLPKSGKYFFAIEMNVIDNAADAFAGLMYMQQADTVRDVSAGGARLIVRGTGSILNDSTGITGLSFVGDGFDELGVAVDCDANTVQFYVNGAPSASAQTPSVSITEVSHIVHVLQVHQYLPLMQDKNPLSSHLLMVSNH